MKTLKELSKTKPIKAYQQSLNALIRNPKLIIPFLIELMIPTLMAGLFIYMLLGPETYNFFYSETMYLTTDRTLYARIFIVVLSSMLASLFIVSYFDTVGLIMCDKAIKGEKEGLINAFRKAGKYYVKMIIIMLSLILIGLCLIFPMLALVSIGTEFYYYYSYGIIAVLSYIMIILYPRVAVVVSKGSGFKALKEGLLFIINYPKYSLANTAIIVVVYAAFSWVYVLSPLAHQLLTSIVLFPWLNLFLTATFKLKVSK